MEMKNVDVAIITVLPEEYQAAIKMLSKTTPYSPTSTMPNLFAWEFCDISCEKYTQPYSILVANTGKPGTVHGALACYKTVSYFQPTYTFFVGIAGGFPKDGQKVTDVAISSTIWGYEYGKIDDGFQPRLDLTYQPDHALLTNCKIFGSGETWDQITKDVAETESTVVRDGIILSGDKVIDNPSQSFFKSVKDKCPHALSVEMEGVGAAIAINLLKSENINSRFLMIRGISDMPRESEDSAQTRERDSNKKKAAENAALFTISYIRNGLPTEPATTQRKIARSLSKTIDPDCDNIQHLLLDKISIATQALLKSQNSNGGIPSTRQGSSSGIWTSASTLESLAVSKTTTLTAYQACRKLTEYILSNQYNSSWPVVCISKDCHGNTISTAHCISALVSFKNYISSKDELFLKVEKSISDALSWIISNQNSDGGWGLEPSSVRGASESRVSSTYYAIKAIAECEYSNADSIFSNASTFILSKQLDTGGWANADDHTGEYGTDSSNTARSALTLLYSNFWDHKDSDLENIIGLLQELTEGHSWEIDSETLPSKNPSGQTVYHNNAPCDVLNLFIKSRVAKEFILPPLHFLLACQNSEGFWPLMDPIRKKPRIPAVTWPTAEFVFTVSQAFDFLK